jgi:hypothetical protein
MSIVADHYTSVVGVDTTPRLTRTPLSSHLQAR